MKPISLVQGILLPALSLAVSLGYDQVYDSPTRSLSTVACSDGSNGMLTRGYTNFSSLPHFPFIGAISAISWNSALCGSCWELTYLSAHNGSHTIRVLAIDTAAPSPQPVNGRRSEIGSGMLPFSTSPEMDIDAENVDLVDINISLNAMNELTDGNAMEFGVVEVDYERLKDSVCGL